MLRSDSAQAHGISSTVTLPSSPDSAATSASSDGTGSAPGIGNRSSPLPVVRYAATARLEPRVATADRANLKMSASSRRSNIVIDSTKRPARLATCVRALSSGLAGVAEQDGTPTPRHASRGADRPAPGPRTEYASVGTRSAAHYPARGPPSIAPGSEPPARIPTYQVQAAG